MTQRPNDIEATGGGKLSFKTRTHSVPDEKGRVDYLMSIKGSHARCDPYDESIKYYIDKARNPKLYHSV